MKKYIVILLSALAVSAAPACSKCQSVLPQLVQAQTKVTDAQRAMTQAQSVLATAQMPPEVRKQLSEAIEKGWAALHAASKVISAGTALCSETDEQAIFSEFNLAWKAIKTLLALFSVGDDGMRYGVHLGTPAQKLSIQDPIVYR